MKVFTITAPEGYEWVLPAVEREIEMLRFDGQPRADSWRPIAMRRLARDEQGHPLLASDFPSCSGGEMLMLRRKAIDALGEILRCSGELLPLACPEGELWTLNVTNLVDALDEASSEVLRLPESGKILRVKKPVFRSEAIQGQEVFKLSAIPRGLIYVTDSFVDRVRAEDLRGIDFKQVWE